jgi:hypothetical protein
MTKLDTFKQIYIERERDDKFGSETWEGEERLYL